MRSTHRPFLSVLAAAAILSTVLAGCAESDPPPSAEDTTAPPVDEPAPGDGQVCPRRLPQSDDASHGFGTSEPATSAPALAAPEKAWVCRYDAKDASAPGGGATMGWARKGAVAEMAPDRLAALEPLLGEVVPADVNRMCTRELGPRWMLVYAHGTDLTGVVVDDFGCRDVRLTDDPFAVVPGGSSAEGIVPGVLQAPAGLLDTIKKSARAR